MSLTAENSIEDPEEDFTGPECSMTYWSDDVSWETVRVQLHIDPEPYYRSVEEVLRQYAGPEADNSGCQSLVSRTSRRAVLLGREGRRRGSGDTRRFPRLPAILL